MDKDLAEVIKFVSELKQQKQREQRNACANHANGVPSWSSRHDLVSFRNSPPRWNQLPADGNIRSIGRLHDRGPNACHANKYNSSAGKEERLGTYIQQQKPFGRGVVPANQYGFNNYRNSRNQYDSLEGYRRWPNQHPGHDPGVWLHHGPLSVSSQRSSDMQSLYRSTQREQTHDDSTLGTWQPSGSYCYREPQFRTNGDRQFSNRPQAQYCQFQDRGVGNSSWRERYVYRRTEQPHHLGKNVCPETSLHQHRAPEKGGMKRGWCVEESSDSPQQGNAKMRTVSAGQTLRWQQQHGGSGVLTHKLPTVMQGVMNRDRCEAEASVSPSHINNSEVRLEESDHPYFQVRDSSFENASNELSLLEQGGMIRNFGEGEGSDILGQHKHQAHQDGSSRATSHKLSLPEQQRMETDLCNKETSDVSCQVQDGSSEAAACEMAVPDQGSTETDLEA